MSPYEGLFVPKLKSSIGHREILLRQCSVTNNGFLPEDEPLPRLRVPRDYYYFWEALVDRIPNLIQQKAFRDWVDRLLPVRSTRYLKTEPEWRRAYVVLSFLAHAYIWGDDTPAEVLPPQITVPFLEVSRHLGLPPVATYASLNLWNFRTTNGSKDFTDLDSIHAVNTFTGTEDESWFYMVSVAIEAEGARIIPVMLEALDGIEQQEYLSITNALSQLADCIHKLTGLLDRMKERCDPSVFYHRIRPFLAGSKNMAAAGLPRGVFYDEGNGKGQWRELRGGSNGQSTLIQFLDLVLGVEHKADGNSNPDQPATTAERQEKKEMGYLEEVRAYMPEPHRKFLQRVSESYPGGMRRGVAKLVPGERPLTEEQLDLREAFQKATKALADLRSKHLQIVAKYILIPSGRSRPDMDGKINLATVSSKTNTSMVVEGEPPRKLTGTGGTALMPFLRQSRDETIRAGRLE
ncbi:Indoleamine 2,3-dioxygenase [Canariomyces notabilis]|uniref:Indoleamine 2,3-dioxygenase n=1 Tax=Canariomyces notabilis TaxID=2074819 RepID=A0AAN6QCK6_9PEZI|nr:Indoleamine 2,3-dioxygenase [Canariomyces arenarius]